MQTARLEDRPSFITADGSSIRELAGIPSGNAANQSLAEATVPPGSSTIEHFHRTSEEIYLFTRGMGRMHLGDQDGPVRAGDTRDGVGHVPAYGRRPVPARSRYAARNCTQAVIGDGVGVGVVVERVHRDSLGGVWWGAARDEAVRGSLRGRRWSPPAA